MHDGAQARAAIEEARDAFETFNLDLMYALPGQTLDELDADLRRALSYRAAAPVDLPPDDRAEHAVREAPAGAARRRRRVRHARPDHRAHRRRTVCERYEVSAFAQPGHRCAHNLNYWQFGDYLGIGAGAHGKLSFPHRMLRQVRCATRARYMAQALAGNAVAQDDEVARTELPFEFMLNALRLKQGFDLASLPGAHRTRACNRRGRARRGRAPRPGRFATCAAHGRVRAGFDFLNDLQAIFLPE